MATYGGPTDPLLRARWRRDRRSAVRRHHPDRGGAPDALRRQLAAVDGCYQRAERTTAPAPAPATASTLPGRSVWRSPLRVLRARIPPGWPGHRRYFEI